MGLCRSCRNFIVSFFCPHVISGEDNYINISNQARVYTLWFVLIAIFLSAGLSHGLGKYTQRNTVPEPDQMYFVDWLSNTWCVESNVTTKWPLRVNAYLLNREPTSRSLCNQSTKVVASLKKTSVPAYGFHMMELGLEKGARISGKICMSEEERFYIFDRNMDFLPCLQSDSWTKCGLNGPKRWRVESNCVDFSKFDDPYIFHPELFNDGRVYYFIFYNSLSTPMHVSAIFTQAIFNEELQRRAVKSCQDATLCRFNLGGIHDERVICFEATRNDPFPGDKDLGKDVRVTCKPRLWLYFMLFAIIPVVLGIIGTILICIYCKHDVRCFRCGPSAPVRERYNPSSYSSPNDSLSRRNRHLEPRSDAEIPSVNNQAYRDTHRDGHRPDVYRDMLGSRVREHTEGPPQYEEALHMERTVRDERDGDTDSSHPDSSSVPPPSYDDVIKGKYVSTV